MPFGFLREYNDGKSTDKATALEWVILKGKSDITDETNRKYWRIYDNLYDLSEFKHPGGTEWISMTRGNDITELFESSHPDIEKVKKIIPKYLIGSANEPRNSGAFTFEKNGFYSVFRERAWQILKECGTGPTQQMLLIHDSLLLIFITLLTIAMNPNIEFSSWILIAIMCGFCLQCLGTCSHNFYHRKANWRMYTWDITPYSSHEWKISHVYSHHTYPNTSYDFECMIPNLDYFPHSKSMSRLLLSPIVLEIIACVAMYLQGIQRFVRILTAKQKFRWEHTLPIAVLLFAFFVRSYWSQYYTIPDGIVSSESLSESFYIALIRVNVMYLFTSFFFHNISLATGHHHPNIWHQGDKIPDKMDWGIFQIISVARFEMIDRSLFLSSVAFGNHTLHHLLPTVDHSKLPLLQSVYIETCKEFGIDFKDEYFISRETSILMGWIAMCRQLFRTKASSDNFPFKLKHL